jgi:large subunit ribosomal protein L6
MISLLLPSTLQLSFAPSILILKGPRGTIRLATGTLQPRIRDTPTGRRLVIGGVHQATSDEATLLAHIARSVDGVRVGIRNRLRLVGVGFRATISKDAERNPVLSIKLGYREERQVPLMPFKKLGIEVAVARREGRSKGTLVRIEGTHREGVNQLAANLRKFRIPDPYKGKGIQYDTERIVLKKGKRE